MVEYLPEYLGGLFDMLSDPNKVWTFSLSLSPLALSTFYVLARCVLFENRISCAKPTLPWMLS
jgi:hypothetical protein